MSYGQCVHKPDLKSFQREIWAQALLGTLWGCFLLILLFKVLVTAIHIQLHPGVISLLWMGRRELTVVHGCNKNAVCLEEISWIGFDLYRKWTVEILGTLTQKNRKHAFSSSNGLQQFNLFFCCQKGQKPNCIYASQSCFLLFLNSFSWGKTHLSFLALTFSSWVWL